MPKYTKIIGKNSEESPKKLEDDYHTKASKGAKVPWIQVNNLYLSPLMAGNEGWILLMKDLYDDKKVNGNVKVQIITGRHGSTSGTPLKDDLTIVESDSDHLKEDEENLRKNLTVNLLKQYGFEFTLADAGSPPLNTPKSLIDHTSKFLKNGDQYIVVWAWCYSVLSCYTHQQFSRVETIASIKKAYPKSRSKKLRFRNKILA